MFLNGYIEVSENLTQGGAPIDAFQADAFRQNDLLFEKKIKALLASPWASSGADGVQNTPSPTRFLHATTIEINADVTATAGVPIVWFATERIRISKKINAQGAGAPSGQNGDFGGAGGADGATAGFRPLLPLSSQPLIAIAANKDLTAAASPTDLSGSPLATRILSMIGLGHGGAAGGGATGGAGGGIVILCAPVIEFQSPDGQIDARGADSAAAGGGGGGMVVLIANKINGLTDTGAGKNVLLDGGNQAVAARRGGHGGLLKREFH